MSESAKLSLETYQRAIQILRIGNEAVRKARQENREMGIASVYSENGRLYWELPNGEITFEDPYREGGPLADAPLRPKKSKK